jgi:hypothetical protein
MNSASVRTVALCTAWRYTVLHRLSGTVQYGSELTFVRAHHVRYAVPLASPIKASHLIHRSPGFLYSGSFSLIPHLGFTCRLMLTIDTCVPIRQFVLPGRVVQDTVVRVS